MDPQRFDRLAVAFGALRSRRETARLLAAGVAAALGLREIMPSAARPAGRCHPDQPDGASCGACRTCQKGRCVAVENGTECSSGKGACAICLDGTCRAFQVGDPCGKASCFICRESGQCEPLPDGARCASCHWCQNHECVKDFFLPGHCGFCKTCHQNGRCENLKRKGRRPGGECQKNDDCCDGSNCHGGVCCVIGDGYCHHEGDCCSGQCVQGRCSCVASGQPVPGDVCLPDDANLDLCCQNTAHCKPREGCPGSTRCLSQEGTACTSDCECPGRCEEGRCCNPPGFPCDEDVAVYCCTRTCIDINPTTGNGVCA